jgi:hypothetical protein
MKKPPQKVAYLLQLTSWEVFFSAAPTAQNSSELYFRFINSFIQPSLVGTQKEEEGEGEEDSDAEEAEDEEGEGL